MKKDRVPIFTVIAFILILILFVGYNALIHINIQKLSYSENWGGHTVIGESWMNVESLMSTYVDNTIVVSYDNNGRIIYYLIDSTGEKIIEGKMSLDFFDRNISDKLMLVENSLFYINNGNMYVSKFDNQTGFGEGKLIFKNSKGFTLINDNNFTVYNEDWLYSIEYKQGSMIIKQQIKNIWDIESAYIYSDGEDILVYILNKPAESSLEVIYGSMNQINNLKTIKKIESMNSLYFGSTSSVLIGKNFYTNTPIRVLGAQGAVTFSNLLISVNYETKEINFANEFSENPHVGLYNIDYKTQIFKNNDSVYFCGSGYNSENQFTENNDIFISKVKADGTLAKPEYISNTYGFSKNPVVAIRKNGEINAVWLDITGSRYDLNFNSTNESYKQKSSIIGKDDYKKALLNSSVAPFYALSIMLVRSSFMMIVFFSVIGVAYIIMYNKGLKNWDKGLKLLTGIFVIVNLLTFNFNYIAGVKLLYMPSYLYGGIYSIIVPLFINSLSIFVLWIFCKERPYTGVLWKIILLIIVDAYFANLLYAPFLVLGKLIN